MSYSQALAWRYIAHSVRPRGQSIAPQRVFIPSAQGPLSALRFVPHPPASGRPVLIALNGYAARGSRDPRMLRAASNLAKCSFDVYMPVLPSVEALLLAPQVVDELAAFIAALSASVQRPVCIFSASLTASLALVACSRPELRQRVPGILAIGPYANLLRTVDYVMHQGRDPYGRHVIWMNFAERISGPNPALLRLFRTAIDDDGWQRRHPHLPGALRQADPHTRALFKRFAYDPVFSDMHWREVAAQLRQDPRWLGGMNPLDRVTQLQSALYLLHGRSDEVIPPRESQDLHRAYRAVGGRSSLLLSPLISHADLTYSWRTPFDAWQLSRLLAAFFSRASRAQRLQHQVLHPESKPHHDAAARTLPSLAPFAHGTRR
jgi:hypothetical protein